MDDKHHSGDHLRGVAKKVGKGLTRKSVWAAKGELNRLGIVEWTGNGQDIDTLCPRWDFQIVITPASPGHIWVDFNNTEE